MDEKVEIWKETILHYKETEEIH